MKPPRFSLRLLLLSFVLCAVIFSWLSVRKRSAQLDLQGHLAILESQHTGFTWQLEQEKNIPWSDHTEPYNVRARLGITNWEIHRTRGQLGQPLSNEIRQVANRAIRYIQDRARSSMNDALIGFYLTCVVALAAWFKLLRYDKEAAVIGARRRFSLCSLSLATAMVAAVLGLVVYAAS